MIKEIVTIDKKEDEKFLRKKTQTFSFSPKGEPIVDNKQFSRGEFSKLILEMRKVMKSANGIGLSANQIGLSYRMFVGQVPSARGGENKFYCVLNPELEKVGTEKTTAEEGCLSVHGTYGTVGRAEKVVLTGFDKFGKPLKVKAWGLLARMFQHEVDHLDGKLFLDRAVKVYNVESSK
jgi:peptide deformylase